jgi:antitoxin FitA
MNKHIQVRNVPDGVYRTLKERAAAKGLSLSDYLRRELERLVAVPTFEELVEPKRATKRLTVAEIFAEIRRQGPVESGNPIGDMMRTERENR